MQGRCSTSRDSAGAAPPASPGGPCTARHTPSRNEPFVAGLLDGGVCGGGGVREAAGVGVDVGEGTKPASRMSGKSGGEKASRVLVCRRGVGASCPLGDLQGMSARQKWL